MARSQEEALEILKIIRGEDDDIDTGASGRHSSTGGDQHHHSSAASSSCKPHNTAASALELLERERKCAPITTFSANLDGLLSGHSVYRGVQKVQVYNFSLFVLLLSRCVCVCLFSAQSNVLVCDFSL